MQAQDFAGSKWAVGMRGDGLKDRQVERGVGLEDQVAGIDRTGFDQAAVLHVRRHRLPRLLVRGARLRASLERGAKDLLAVVEPDLLAVRLTDDGVLLGAVLGERVSEGEVAAKLETGAEGPPPEAAAAIASTAAVSCPFTGTTFAMRSSTQGPPAR